MADKRRPQTPTESQLDTAKMIESNMIFIDESITSYPDPVLSNRVLIRGGEARIFKTTSDTDLDNLSEESVVEAVMFDSQFDSDSMVCVLIKKAKNKDEKVTEVEDKLEEDLDWDESLSSEDYDAQDSDSLADAYALPNTLRLLEQVSFMILGEKMVTIPEIEKVEEKEQGESTQKKAFCRKALKDQEEQLGENYRQYWDTVAFSQRFVEDILVEAKHICKTKHKKKVVVIGFQDYKNGNIIWPSIKEFKVELGIESIDMYIQHGFVLKESWRYKITFLIAQSDKASDFYLFEAKFSIPTACYPIPQATVSVFFTFEVSRVIPKKYPVRVTFTLESLRTVMVPGEVEINDKSLLMVLYAKLEVYKQLFF